MIDSAEKKVNAVHEFPVTQSICRIATEEARRIGARKVTRIFIAQGDYTDYVPEIIQEYFNIVSEGTLAEGAQLHIRKIPAVLHCRDCGMDSVVEHYRMRCPLCLSRETELKSGKEFYIESMEVEEDGD